MIRISGSVESPCDSDFHQASSRRSERISSGISYSRRGRIEDGSEPFREQSGARAGRKKGDACSNLPPQPSYLVVSCQIKKTVSISLMPANVSLLHYKRLSSVSPFSTLLYLFPVRLFFPRPASVFRTEGFRFPFHRFPRTFQLSTLSSPFHPVRPSNPNKI